MLVEAPFHLLVALLLLLITQVAHSARHDMSVVEMNGFLEEFFTRSNSVSVYEWESNLPTREEKEDMRKLLSYVYRLNTFEKLNGNLLKNYAYLEKYLNITVLQGHYCVIHELVHEKMRRFPRMWGYTVIASKSFAIRPIHHSATHFDSDGPVCTQAATLFENTGSRTLVIAGASRFAVTGDHRSECQDNFQLADAAHTNRTMFHDLAELEAQAEGKDNGYFFIQWHGMAETSCLASDVFLSAGIHNGSIYEADIPVRRLLTSLKRLAPGMKVSTPREDVDCRLTASTNVFGRYINGVSRENVCNTSAHEKDVLGKFAHVEQKAASRSNIPLWTAVIKDAFPVSQASPRHSSVFLITYLCFLFTAFQ